MWKKLEIEFETALIAGHLKNGFIETKGGISYDILQFGGALRTTFKLLNDTLRTGLEIGMASTLT